MIAGLGAKLFRRTLIGKPSQEVRTGNICPINESATQERLFHSTTCVVDMLIRVCLAFKISAKLFDVIFQGLSLSIFEWVAKSGLKAFGFPFEVGGQLRCCLLIRVPSDSSPSAGRIAKLDVPFSGLLRVSRAAIRQWKKRHPTVALKSHKPITVLGNDVRVSWERFRGLNFEKVCH
jgi:hypothetical protein